MADGAGGAFIAWQDLRNGNDDIYVQRVTASGEIAPGWSPDGIPVCVNPASQFLAFPTSDGQGGVILAWSDHRNFVAGGTSVDIYAQRILADGSIAPGWPVDGAPVSRAPGRQRIPFALADGTGGAFFTWYEHTPNDVYLQRLSPAGEPMPGWPSDGLPVCVLPSTQLGATLAPDGAGGVLVAWGDFRDGPLAAYAQRITPDGAVADGWPENGVRIVLDRAIRGLIADGLGGGYVSCATLAQVHDDDYYLQRFMADGTIAPGWPEGGVPVCLAPDERNSLRMVPDGSGGALLAWADYRDFIDDDIFALRVQPDGTLYPGWPVNGLRVTNNTALDDVPDLAPDGLGGAYITWDRYTTAAGDRVVVQHLMGAGTIAPGWPSDGALIPADVPSGGPRIAADGVGGAIVAWERVSSGTAQIRALRFNADGVVPVAVALVSAEAHPGLVRLAWHMAATTLVATVERRTAAEDWQRLAEVTPDGTGRLEYEDRVVQAGTKYGYRLAWREGNDVVHSAETWMEVPTLRFALRGVTPNPSAGDPVVAFSLASTEPVALELYDLSGRLVHARGLGSPGAGAHSVRLETGGRLPAGVFTVRLRQGAHSATARAVIVR